MFSFCLKLVVGFVLLLQCFQLSSLKGDFFFSPWVTSLQQPCWRNELPFLSLLMVCWIHKIFPNLIFCAIIKITDPTVEAWTSSPQSLRVQIERWQSWGNQIWSLLEEKVNQCGKPPSHCLSSCRGLLCILSVEWRSSGLSMFLEIRRIPFTMVILQTLNSTVSCRKQEHLFAVASLVWSIRAMLPLCRSTGIWFSSFWFWRKEHWI